MENESSYVYRKTLFQYKRISVFTEISIYWSALYSRYENTEKRRNTFTRNRVFV